MSLIGLKQLCVYTSMLIFEGRYKTIQILPNLSSTGRPYDGYVRCFLSAR